MDSLDVLEATNSIVLNSHESLELPSASLTLVSSPAQSLQPTKQSFDPKNERTSWAFAETLPAGSKAVFRVAFKGVLDGSMTGYYKSTWDGGIYTLTQFEVSLCQYHHLFHPSSGRYCSAVEFVKAGQGHVWHLRCGATVVLKTSFEEEGVPISPLSDIPNKGCNFLLCLHHGSMWRTSRHIGLCSIIIVYELTQRTEPVIDSVPLSLHCGSHFLRSNWFAHPDLPYHSFHLVDLFLIYPPRL